MMKLQVLGSGCSKCQKLAEAAETAAKQLGIEYQLEKITDLQEIMRFGIMTTPALAVDGVVRLVGRVPDLETLKGILGNS